MRKVCERTGLSVWHSWEEPNEPPDWDVCIDIHSKQILENALARNDRAVAIIRDPRDVIISSATYHLDAREPWLHEPQDWLEGRTYQETIRALDTEEDRLLFEMERRGGRTIEEMCQLDPSDPRLRIFKLEDLMSDTQLHSFHALFVHLGFEAEDLVEALSIAVANSVFGRDFSRPRHMRSGKLERWRRVFSDRIRSEFEQRFPDALDRLGYPPF